MLATLLLSFFCLTQIPLSLTEEGMPKVTAVIAGKEVDAWVDLGRGIALIEESKLPAGTVTSTGITVNTQGFNELVKKENVVQIPSIQLGNATFVDVKGTIGTSKITSYSITPKNTKAESNNPPTIMLGNEIFLNGVLLVDYKGGAFEYGKTVSEFRELDFQRWALLPFKMDKGQIQFMALNRGLSGHWILDSGSTINLIYKGFYGPLKFSKTEDQVINFGRFPFVMENLYYTNKPLKTGIFGIVGAPFLRKYRVLIDFPRQHLYVEA